MTEETINQLCEKFHTTMDNLIPVYSKYMVTKDIIGIVIEIIIIAVCISILTLMYQNYKQNKYDEFDVLPFVIITTSAITLLIFVICFLYGIYDLILWHNCPELRFLDTVLQIGG